MNAPLRWIAEDSSPFRSLDLCTAWKSLTGTTPYRSGDMNAPLRWIAEDSSPPLEQARATAVGGTIDSATDCSEKVVFTGQFSSSLVAVNRRLSYSSAIDITAASVEPTRAAAEKDVKAAAPTPFETEESRPPPRQHRLHASYMTPGMREPMAIAAVVLVLSKSSSLVTV